MLVECTNCNAHVEADLKGEFHYAPGEYNEPGRYALLRCKRCYSALLIDQENTGNLAEGDVWGRATVLYPQLELRVNPKAPAEIRAAVEEGIKCYQARAFTAAAIMCRKVIEGVCEAHGVKEGTLDKSLKRMLETDKIDKRLYEWSDQLRIIGNEAAHGVGIISSADDARDALDFAIAVIDYLFSYRDQFEKFKARRQQAGDKASSGKA